MRPSDRHALVWHGHGLNGAQKDELVESITTAGRSAHVIKRRPENVPPGWKEAAEYTVWENPNIEGPSVSVVEADNFHEWPWIGR